MFVHRRGGTGNTGSGSNGNTGPGSTYVLFLFLSYSLTPMGCEKGGLREYPNLEAPTEILIREARLHEALHTAVLRRVALLGETTPGEAPLVAAPRKSRSRSPRMHQQSRLWGTSCWISRALQPFPVPVIFFFVQ